ncbi:MAG: HAD family hydrolase [Clostridium lundense]|nr:HAD family hydrolase [Clostridium lundense]
MPIKTIIFDLDDTLYNEREFVYGAFSEVCKYISIKFNKDYERLHIEVIRILNEQGRGKIFNLLCDKYNINEDINKLVEIYRAAKPDLQLYEDALHALRKYKGNSMDNIDTYNIGLITDGKASVQWNKIKSLKLEQHIDKIIVTDDFGIDFWKPNEFAYREMMKYFNSSAEQCVYIGDNPHKDFIGPRRIGMYTVRVIREIGDHMNTFLDKEHEADFTIKKLDELENIIKNLESN